MARLGDVIEGLEILASREGDGLDAHAIAADHDVIYAGPSIDRGSVVRDAGGEPIEDGLYSADQVRRLVELGWHISSEADCWARFV